MEKIINELRTNRYLQIFVVIISLVLIYLIFKKQILKLMSVEQRIRLQVISRGLPPNFQKLLVAQAKHETANFSSNAFKKNNNLYGYKSVKGAKWQTGAGITSSEGNAYAHYASIEDSVNEVIDWIKRRQKEGKFPADLRMINSSEYAQLLKNSGYYGDTVANYTRGLNHYLA